MYSLDLQPYLFQHFSWLCRQTVVNLCMQITGWALIQSFFCDLSVLVIPDNLILVHAVFLLGPEFELVPENPQSGNPDILVHGRRHGADHPAVPVAAANLLTDGFGLRAVPQLFPGGCFVYVPHNLLILGAVAGHHISVRVDEKGIWKPNQWTAEVKES